MGTPAGLHAGLQAEGAIFERFPLVFQKQHIPEIAFSKWGNKCMIYIIDYMKELQCMLNYPFLQLTLFSLPGNTSNSHL